MATKQYNASLDTEDGSAGNATLNLLALRNLLKRDPAAYEEEFAAQTRHFQSLMMLFEMEQQRPKSAQEKNFVGLIEFLSHTIALFPHNEDAKQIPGKLMDLMSLHAASLSQSLRKTILQALLLLRNRQAIAAVDLLPLLFKLFCVQDKALRVLLFSDLVSYFRKNARSSFAAPLKSYVMKLIGTALSADLSENDIVMVQKALGLAMELYRKNVWTDEKTVNILAECAFSKVPKISHLTLHFLLCQDEIDDEVADPTNDPKAYGELLEAVRENSMASRANKRNAKRKRMIERAKEKMRKMDRSNREEGVMTGPISLLYDPQTFAERLFSALQKTNEAFNIRILYLNVISRIIGCHNVLLFNFYPYVQRYIEPHQQDVTQLLAYLVQASHRLVPPDVLEPCIKKLANQFVSDRSSPEVMAVGINTIREICTRQPLAMQADLLQDLTQYKKHRDKGVIMAARSLISLFRVENPLLLSRKDRGRDFGSGNVKAPAEYGDIEIAMDVEGADLLHAEELQKIAEGSDEEEDEWDEEHEMASDSENESDEFEDDDEPELVDDEEADAIRQEILEQKELVAKHAAEKPFSATKIFTPKDFERLKVLQMKQAMVGSRQKRSRESDCFVDGSELEAVSKKLRKGREERIALMKQNQAEMKKLGYPGKRAENLSSSTNEEKKRLKPFVLTKHSSSVRRRNQADQGQKHARAMKHLNKVKTQNKHRKRKRRH